MRHSSGFVIHDQLSQKGKSFYPRGELSQSQTPHYRSLHPLPDIYVKASDILQTDALFPVSAVSFCGLIYLTISQEAFLCQKGDLVNILH